MQGTDGGDRYDLVVVGGGPAGEKAAAAAAFWGKRVAIVDSSPRAGGAMVRGVVATKTMREAALYLTSFRRRDVYDAGLDLTADVAASRVHRRIDDVVTLTAEQAMSNLRRHHVDYIRGRGTIGADRSITVQSDDGAPARTLAATAIVIATGSRPHHPEGVPFDDPDILDSDTAAALDRPLRSLVVVGAGAVGCEFASIFTALGADVVLVNSGPRLLPFMDDDAAAHLDTVFAAMGMRVLHDAGHTTARRGRDGLEVVLADGEVLRPDKVIFATGRIGNTSDLGLDGAGVATDERGRIVVDEHYKTTADGIYAAGDVVGPPALASVAMEQARQAARWACDLPLKRVGHLAPPYGVYAVPEVAMVGLTEQQARDGGLDYAVGSARFTGNTRAAISGATDGLVKLVFNRDDLRLLGVHIVGDAATELIHVGQAVLHFGGTIEYFVHSTFNVPTLSEAYKYAAYDGLGNVNR